MNIDINLEKDGLIVLQKIDTETIINITNSISKKIVKTFPNFGLDEQEIFGKLFTLKMFKADIPQGTLDASYCYKNSSIYFNYQIENEDLEEFAIHECLHYLQEVKDKNNNLIKLGLADYTKLIPTGIGLNEAAVQYISSKIIGINPDFEKYFDLNLFTPSPSYYPVECALLNELVFFIGEDILFKSTYFSNDYFKDEIIYYTSKKTYKKIVKAFDLILQLEEKIISLNNKDLSTNDDSKIQEKIEQYRIKIKDTFLNTQNIIIKEFFDSIYNTISSLEDIEYCRRKLSKFKLIVGTADNYNYFENYYKELMNKLEHKTNILENGGIETAITPSSFSVFNIFGKIRDLINSKKTLEK